VLWNAADDGDEDDDVSVSVGDVSCEAVLWNAVDDGDEDGDEDDDVSVFFFSYACHLP